MKPKYPSVKNAIMFFIFVVIQLSLGLNGADYASGEDKLVGRAVLPAAMFSPGPTSGTLIGTGPINGQEIPFIDKQPVQGFSAVIDNGDGTFMVMSDNGFGSMENSSDYNLRVYKILPDFKTKEGGKGYIYVLDSIELHDPDRHIPFAITNYFTEKRILTGADFDIESMQGAADGTLWFGDEFGPFLIHTDPDGKVLEPPIPLPDFDNPGKDIRSPQNPFNEEASAIRIMNAVRTHARMYGNKKTPVFSPWHVMFDDANPNTYVGNRKDPPAGSGLPPTSSELFNIKSIQRAGYPIVTWTVNDKARMLELMRLGINGIISDRPDLLRQAVEEFDANGDGVAGDLLGPDGLIDINKFDAKGHRGGRNLRPENTLPAMEVALDYLITTLELDNGVAHDGIPVLNHDPYINSQKCRRANGLPYGPENEVLIKDLTLAEIQYMFICDKVFRGPEQVNDLSLSPVSVAFTTYHGLMHPYVMPSTQQLFDFVNFYIEYYRSRPVSFHPDSHRRWMNAQKVRFNIETKINPRTDADEKGNVFAQRTIEPWPFAQAVATVIKNNSLESRADIQSFDFRTLLIVQEQYPEIRTVYLFGDFPIYANNTIPGSDDGTNLQGQNRANTPWLAGLYWPYRVTALDHPFRAQRSGGFEGMALSHDKTRLLPLLEKPLIEGEPNTLLIHEFDLSTKRYTGKRYKYILNERGKAIGDFIMFSKKNGLVIERDDTQGDLNGFKVIYEIELEGADKPVEKKLAVDLLQINDPHKISEPGQPGDIGIGKNFAFPFVTIEDVVVFDHKHIGVLNDNNFPFSVGRHVGSGQPDDNEFIIIKLDRPLGGH